MEYVLTAVVLLSALVQGGFFPSMYLAAGIFLAVVCAFQKQRKPVLAEILLWAFAIWYPIASLLNGYDSASMAQACLPAAGVCFLRCYLNLSTEQRQRMITAITLGSVGLSVIGIMAFCGLLEIRGAVTSHRLQFPFQYANAAGSWYAATALLLADDEKRKSVIIPILTALFLTKSVGAVGLYILCSGIRLYRKSKIHALSWEDEVVIYGSALLFTFGFDIAHGYSAAIPMILLFLTHWRMCGIIALLKRFRLYWTFLLCGIVGIGWNLFSRRMDSALRTFAERLIQIHDGSMAIIRFPLIGLGAGNWQYLYGKFQTAQYASAVIHSGIIQTGVDAGAIALLLGMAVALSLWRDTKSHAPLAAFLLIIHSAADFTMKFFPITALTLILLFSSTVTEAPKHDKLLFRGLFLTLAIFFAVTFGTEQVTKRLNQTAQMGDWPLVIGEYEQAEPFLGRNRSAKTPYLSALYHTGQFASVIEKTQDAESLSEQETVLRARSLWEIGKADEASALLLDTLAERKHRVVLFEEISQLLLSWDAPSDVIEAYNSIVHDANAQRSALAILKGDQIDINTLEKEK